VKKTYATAYFEMFKVIYLKALYRSKSVMKSGSILKPRYIRFRVISDRVMSGLQQGRNQLSISGGGNFHEISFDDVIVLTQPWYSFLANGHR